MEFVHVFMALFALWRLVEIVQIDAIFGPVRRFISWLPWWLGRNTIFNFISCHRCISVWLGAIVTLLVYLGGPYAYINWAFALSFLFIRGQELYLVLFNRLQGGIYIDPVKGQVNWGGFSPQAVLHVLQSVVSDTEQRLAARQQKG